MMIYLNWAGLAPLPLRSYLGSLFAPELLGTLRLDPSVKRIERLREKVALWLGCKPSQVAFMPSTSVALTAAAYSLDWQEGDRVCFPKHDFPANILPWQRLARFGVQPLAVDYDDQEVLKSLPKLVSISTVDFTTGIEQPWKDIVKQAHSQGIWTCVDAIQSAGVKPSWCPEIDFWCAGTQKWLASGLGLAILVLSDRVLNKLPPPFPTHLGLNEPPLLDSGMCKTARGWEVSWASPQAYKRFEINLDWFQQQGWETITDGVKKRRDYLSDRLQDIGFNVVSCPQRWTGLVSFAPNLGQSEKIVQAGYNRRIIMAQKGDLVRLSPHIFNSMRSLEKTIDWLSQYK